MVFRKSESIKKRLKWHLENLRKKKIVWNGIQKI